MITVHFPQLSGCDASVVCDASQLVEQINNDSLTISGPSAMLYLRRLTAHRSKDGNVVVALGEWRTHDEKIEDRL